MTEQAKGVAFLVGIDQYDDDRLLNFTDDDRPTENVRTFINDILYDNPFCQYTLQVELNDPQLPYNVLKRELEEFLSNRDYKDVLLYFSGHGYQVVDPEQNEPKGYLATSNSVLHQDSEDKYPYAQRHGFPLTQLSKLIAKATHLDKLTLLVDACHSGLAFQDGTLGSAFQSLEPTFKYCILTSSLGTEQSFGGQFFDALQGELLDRTSGSVRADDLVRGVKGRLQGANQHPKDFSSGASSILLMDYPPPINNAQDFQNSPKRLNPPIYEDEEKGILVCPYRGLKAFDDDETQAEFFFGRDQDIFKINNRLKHSAFVPVIGASGSGKSSVVKAGLVRKQLRQEEGKDWYILPIMKPGESPLKSLRRSLGRLLSGLEDGSDAHKALDDFVYGGASLTVDDFHGVVGQLDSQQHYLLVIDQFEEAFTLTGARVGEPEQGETHGATRVTERDQFLKLVTSVTQLEDSPLRVVVTMRVDFLGHCLAHPALKTLIEKDAVYIAPLVGTGLIDAIEQPALRQGYPLARELTAVLLQDVKTEPGFLPLLEFTLDRLWEKREGGDTPGISLQAYEQLGTDNQGDDDEAAEDKTAGDETTEDDVNSAKKQHGSGLRQALNLHADDVYQHSYRFENPPRKERSEADTEQEQEWIRLIFLKLLRTGEGSTDTRDPQSRESLLAIVDPETEHEEQQQRLGRVIDSLINGRLLVADEGRTPGEQIIDLAHEALIEGWERFRGWRAEDREIRRLAERLEDARRDWQKVPEAEKTGFLINRALLAQVREDWAKLKFYLPDPKAGWGFYRQSDRAEKAEKLEMQLLLEAPRVSRQIAMNGPPEEILTSAIRMVGIDREFFPERFIGSVPASLRQVVESIYTSSPPYGHKGSVLAVAVSPDGQTIVSGSSDNTVRLWNLDGTPKGSPFKGHEGYVLAVAVSPDGQTIVSGSSDNTVRLWNLDGTPKGSPFKGHEGSVYAVAVSPDGQTIVSGSYDNTVQLWNDMGWRSWLRTCLERLGNCWLYDHDDLACRTRLFEEGYIAAEQGELALAQTTLRRALQCGTASFLEAKLTDQELEDSVNQIIEPILIRQAQQSAQLGKVDKARETFEHAQQINPDLSIDPTKEAQRLTAPILKMQGTFAALSLEIDDAIAKFEQAKEYDSTFDLEPEAEAKRLAAPVLVSQGNELAEALDIEGAISKFKQAKEYDFTLELEPEAEAKRLATPVLVSQGNELAEALDVEGAIAKFAQAKEYDSTLDLEPEAEAKRLAARVLVSQGNELAEALDVEGAIAKFAQAKEYDFTLDLEPEAEAKRLAVPVLVNQGEELAKELDVEGAIAKFAQAKEYDSTLDLEPDAEAKRLAAPVLVSQGNELVEALDLEGAISKFEQAKEYDSTLDLEPEAEAKRLAALGLVQQAITSVKEKEVQKALDDLHKAQAYDPDLEIEPYDWAKFCWFGVLHAALQNNKTLIKSVLSVSEAPLRASEDEVLLVLAVARALRGTKVKRKLAIQDFKSCLVNIDSESNRARCQQWIDALEQNQNPFTPEEIESLLNDE